MKYIKTYENFSQYEVTNEELFGIGEVTLNKEEVEKYFNSDNNLRTWWKKQTPEAQTAWVNFMTTGAGLADPKKVGKVLGEFVEKSKDVIKAKAYITAKYKYNEDKKAVTAITAEDTIFSDVQFKAITTNNEVMSAEEKAAWIAKIKELGTKVTDSGVPGYIAPGQLANMFMYDAQSKRLIDRPKDKQKELPKGTARIGGLASS